VLFSARPVAGFRRAVVVGVLSQAQSRPRGTRPRYSGVLIVAVLWPSVVVKMRALP